MAMDKEDIAAVNSLFIVSGLFVPAGFSLIAGYYCGDFTVSFVVMFCWGIIYMVAVFLFSTIWTNILGSAILYWVFSGFAIHYMWVNMYQPDRQYLQDHHIQWSPDAAMNAKANEPHS
jgi:hypothetical protein